VPKAGIAIRTSISAKPEKQRSKKYTGIYWLLGGCSSSGNKKHTIAR
jgi:hypothetical protein